MNIHHAVNGITEMVTYDWLQVSLVSISMYTFAICVPGCVTKCDRGRGSKLAKNSVTYFMDGPIYRTRCGLTNLEKRRTRGDLIEAYKIVTRKEAISAHKFFEVSRE